ncbi:hypothetical protein LTT66_31815 [Nocardia gipuzkoensis]|uniref:hypothetical protein n=1 Tax=Nocardia gipuzkoensis TaxID=2749991 RepID=UPI001E5C5227|nr:hypothetical protein [Nocardia gipuzkoensis]UGT72467.1 hypothetical protein LTT66_31815 [Nocardia gipuzkoensis]
MAATIISATVAAVLLPGRDGVGVYLAESLTAAADAIGYAPRPGWAVAVLIAVAGVGIAVGNRAPSAATAITLITDITIFALTGAADASRAGFVAISIVIALTAGYCCGVARPHETSSGALAIAALYLPTVVSVSPYAERNWHGEQPPPSASPALGALALTIGSALGLAALYRLRRSGTPHLGNESDSEPLLIGKSHASAITRHRQSSASRSTDTAIPPVVRGPMYREGRVAAVSRSPPRSATLERSTP